MRYMLDTNICIYLMRHQPPEVAERFARCIYGEVVMSVVTLAELKCGVSERGEDRSRVAATIERLTGLVPPLALDEDASDQYAQLYKAVRDRRRDALDRLIAAHALAADCVLVTNNEADFRDYPGLRLENWVSTPST
jgi:tRNA(fMet)-specific endonuclease VapC